MQRVALNRDDIDRLRIVRVNGDREAEVAGQIATDLAPVVAAVVAAHDVPVLLHVERVRPARMNRDIVHAVSNVGDRIGDVIGPQALVDRLPRPAAILGPECARRGDSADDAVFIRRIDDDRVQAQSAGARRPISR